MRLPLAIILAAVALTGCGGRGTQGETSIDADLTETIRVLPTPTGLDQSVDVTTATVDDVQEVFAQGRADATAAATYRSIGFNAAAIRRWSGPNGAFFVVVLSRWPNHQTATNVGGGAAETLPLQHGAQAWTPTAVHGARGTAARAGAASEHTLAKATANVSVYIHATGPVTEQAIVRTMDLAITTLDG